MSSYSLSKLQVTNFRNINTKPLSFSKSINCILGENGNGKTNLLEAIYFLLLRKSFRKKAGFSQILSMESSRAELIFSAILESDQGLTQSLSGKVFSDHQEWFWENKPMRKKPTLTPLFISPFDAHIFFNEPTKRREWIDHHLSLIDSDYKKNFSRYKHFIRLKNALLSHKSQASQIQIRGIHQELSELIIKINQTRGNFLKQLRPFLQNSFQQIFAPEFELDLQLETSLSKETPEELFDLLQEKLPKDFLLGHSHKGPHRDHYTVFLNGLNSFEFSSLGQQKMSYLSLIFAYIELFRYNMNYYPIVLLDDVSGELDKSRWSRLIGYLQERQFQTFITTANENFRQELEKIKGSQKIFMRDGDPVF